MAKIKRVVSLLLVLCMCAAAAGGLCEGSFADDVEAAFAEPEINYRGEVRWWMGEAGHTDETIISEITAMHDAGFRGMELCQHVDGNLDEDTYGYGSDQWDHDLHLALSTALDLGMTVSLTSGTNWATANIPGLDPNSPAAEQIVLDIVEYVKAGNKREGPVPMSKKVGGSVTEVSENARLIGVFAVPQVSGNKASPITTDPQNIIELTDLLTRDETGALTLDWTPPDPEGKYRIFYYWQQGACQEAHPAKGKAYCINYFDRAGVDALCDYWTSHILCDSGINEKIAAGDVQLFMDSLEISVGSGCAFWADDMEEQFLQRKGYDIRPYLYLTIGLPALSRWENPDYGTYDFDGDAELRRKVLNDLFDVQTQLYRERMLEPLAEYMHGYGIKTRAQISYGQRLEISEPIMSMDYPEAEVLNQNNQIDIYRIWTGGPKLMGKVLSAEAGAYGGYKYTYQDHLMEAYNLFAAGFSRIIWHVWTAQYGPGENPTWPNYKIPGAIYSNFYSFGTHEPSSPDYPAFNAHLGRISKLMQQGESRTDIGMPYINYQQTTPTMGNHGGENWMLNHHTALFPSTMLQDAGYTYDYFSPAFLESPDVTFSAETGTLEKAGYKAIVIWQDEMTAEGAQKLLELAQSGMNIVIIDGAATVTPYNDGKESQLAETISRMKELPNVRTASAADTVLASLQELGVKPYCGYSSPNRQLLSQMRRDGDREYLYLYNYCDGTYMSHWTEGAESDTHGDTISTDLMIDGTWIPYSIDPWSGKVTEIAGYKHENGATTFPVSLDYGNIALYTFQIADENSRLHATDTDFDKVCMKDGKIVGIAAESGEYTAKLSDGTEKQFTVTVPEKQEITDFDVTFELYEPAETVSTRTETVLGVTSAETHADTVTRQVTIPMEHIKTWDEIPEIGENAIGTSTYTATFPWNGDADGALLNLGEIIESVEVSLNGTPCLDVSMTNPVIDISDYLIPGINSISITYRSNICNASPSPDSGDWYGYRYGKHKYGISQAIIEPYMTETLE